MKFGISLIFQSKNKHGIKAEYIHDVPSKAAVYQIAQSLAARFSKHEENAVRYIGISDLFIVSQEIAEFAILGRSTLFKIKTEKAASKIVQHSFSQQKKAWVVASLVFFYDGIEKKETFTIVADVLLKNTRGNFLKRIEPRNLRVIARQIASINDFDIDLNRLKYVGVENVYGLTSTSFAANPFRILESGRLSISSLTKEVLSEKAVAKFFSVHAYEMDARTAPPTRSPRRPTTFT